VINNYKQNINKLIYVENLNSDSVRDTLVELNIDTLILAGVGIVKDKIISIPNLTILNVHSSVLPGYRGTESEIFALADSKYDLIGNTVHFVNNKIDAGEILSVIKFPQDKLKFGVSYVRYFNKVLSANNLFDTVKNIKSIRPENNDISKSVYRSRPTKEVVAKAKKNSYKCV
jgi:methionyl-tRNA formyltransferase